MWPPATAGVTAAPRASEAVAGATGPHPPPATREAARDILASRRRCAGILGGAAALAILSAAGCAQSPPSPGAMHGPPLWRMRHQDGAGSGWLFGSVHAGLEADERLPPGVEAAWARADVLAIEIDVMARWRQLRGLYAAAALLPGEDTIEGLIGTGRAAAIRTHFDIDEARWAKLRRLAPWALLAVLAGHDAAGGARPAPRGLEARFLEEARRRAMPIVELEQAGEQVEALAGAGLEAQADWLWRRIESMRRGDGLAEAIVTAWRAGDEARLARLKSAAWGDARDGALPRAHMFGERDRRIARRLAALLERPHTVFTLVGAFHLVGEDTLPGILAGQWVRVERVRGRET